MEFEIDSDRFLCYDDYAVKFKRKECPKMTKHMAKNFCSQQSFNWSQNRCSRFLCREHRHLQDMT